MTQVIKQNRNINIPCRFAEMMSANHFYLEVTIAEQSISSEENNVTEPSITKFLLTTNNPEKLSVNEDVYNSWFLKSYGQGAKIYSWTLFFQYPKINLLE